MVSTAYWRTVTLWPMPCETSVSAAVAPPRRAASRTAVAMRSSSPVGDGKVAGVRAGGVMPRRRGLRGGAGGHTSLLRLRPGRDGVTQRGSVIIAKAPALLRAGPDFRQDDARPDEPHLADRRRARSRRRRRGARRRCTRCRTWARRWSGSSRQRLAELGLPERLVDAVARRTPHPRARRPPPPDAVHRQADARHRPRAACAPRSTRWAVGRAVRPGGVRGGRALARRDAARRRRRSTASSPSIPAPTAAALAYARPRRARRAHARRPAASLSRTLSQAAMVESGLHRVGHGRHLTDRTRVDFRPRLRRRLRRQGIAGPHRMVHRRAEDAVDAWRSASSPTSRP